MREYNVYSSIFKHQVRETIESRLIFLATLLYNKRSWILDDIPGLIFITVVLSALT